MDEIERAKAEISSMWTMIAPHYDSDWGHGLRTTREKHAWCEMLGRLLPPTTPMRVLDAGCGTGFLSLLLAEAGHEVIGLDLSEGMLAVAKRTAARRGLDLRLVCGDVEAPPADLGMFDAVVSRHLLWTLPRPEQAVRAWIGLVVPAGRVLAIDVFWPPLPPLRRLAVRTGQMLDRLAGVPAHGYPPDLTMLLPLDHLAGPKPVRELFERVGLADVGVEPLSDIDRVERAAMPLKRRLQFDYQRYLIMGRRPSPPPGS